MALLDEIRKAQVLNLLGERLQGLLDVPTSASRFMVNPTAVLDAVSGKTAMPKEKGFAEAVAQLPQRENLTVLDPANRAYMEGYSQGEPFGYASMALPFAGAGATKLSDKLVQTITKNPSATAMNVIDYASAYNPSQIFIGQGAKSWNPDMAFKAAKMEKAGKSPQEIWKETGTVKAPDGNWRQEISDAGSEINKLPLQDSWENFSRKAEIAKYGSRGADVGKMSNKEFKEFQKFRDDLQQEFNTLTKREAPLSDVLTHKQLYEAYPDIAKLNTMQDKSIGLEGELSPYGIKYGDVSNKDNLRGLFLHEGQHGIQLNEGWALGGSPKNYTQQAEAELAKKALLMRSEIDAMPSSIPFDERAKTVKELFEKLDQTPIDKKTMDLVKDYTDNPSSQLEEIANFYGLDRRSSAMSPDDVYKRLFGEAEARLTQSRRDLTPEQRLEYFPYNQGQYGLDVPLNEVIVRGLLGK